jgi:predicted amidophosphoribosyltransferase
MTFLGRLLADVGALVAPPGCVACRAPTASPHERLCAACARALPWLRRGCPRCGLPSHRARGCPAAAAAFPQAWAPLAYEGVARDLVAALKFRGALPVADLMAAHMAANLPRRLRGPGDPAGAGEPDGRAAAAEPDDHAAAVEPDDRAAAAEPDDRAAAAEPDDRAAAAEPDGRAAAAEPDDRAAAAEPDDRAAAAEPDQRAAGAAVPDPAGPGAAVLVPVPALPSRRRRRGFDPAAVLAGALGRRLERPVVRCLERRDHSGRQVGAGRAARRAPGRLVVAVRASPPRAALLVDDVHTTGATLDACARALAAAGTVVVAALSYARTL